MKHSFSKLLVTTGIACGLSVGAAFAQNGGGAGTGTGQGGAGTSHGAGEEAGHVGTGSVPGGTGNVNVGSGPGATNSSGGPSGTGPTHDGSNATGGTTNPAGDNTSGKSGTVATTHDGSGTGSNNDGGSVEPRGDESTMPRAAESVASGSQRPMHGSLAGTITELIPDMSAIIARINENRTMLYHYNASTAVVDPDGKKILIDQLRTDTPATFTYSDDGGGHLNLNKVELQSPAENDATAAP
ncbi:MAG: hypothetical protein ABI233_12460 [Chthoniobacterales bacterium]